MHGIRRRRRLLLLLAVLALLVAFAPQLARTGLARDFVAGRVSAALGRPVELEGLEAGWFSGISVRGLRVRNAAAEFRAANLVEARAVRLESTLPGLVLGSGAERIVVEGLVLRLEEQAGGRTNVDDLWERLAAPAPPAPPPEERKPPKPLRVHLADASIHVRRLVRRPQPRPVDPFREDPVVLDASEGLFVLGLDDLDLRLDATPESTSLEVTSAIRLGDTAGHADVSLRFGPGGPAGSVELRGIDLSLLGAFVPGTIAGRIDLAAKGSGSAGVDVTLVAHGLRVDSPGLPALDEEWLRLAGRIRRDGDGIAADALSLGTASGACALEGRGSWPPRPGTELEVRGHAPAEILGLDARGAVHLDARGTGTAAGIDVAGTLRAPELVLAGHEGTNPVEIRFDVGILGDRLALRSVGARGGGIDVDLAGDFLLAAPVAANVSGRADLDLDRAAHLLAPQLAAGDATLLGRLFVPRFELRAGAGGDLQLRAEGQLTDFTARGVFDEDLRIERSEVHVDAALAEGGDVLHVARARLDDLRASGTVEGLAKRRPFRAEGTVEGTLELNPLHARLAGLADVTSLAGRLTVNAGAATEHGSTRIQGTAAIVDLHVAGAFGAWDLPRVALEGDGRAGEGSHAGKVSARGEGFAIDASLENSRARLAMEIDAIERQPLLARLLELPPGVALEGPVKLHADVDGVPGAWRIEGTVESPGLTAARDGRGLSRAEVRATFAAREQGHGWTVTVPEASLPGLGATARVEEAVFGRDGAISASLRVDGPLDALASLAPEAARLRPAGTLVVDARVAKRDGWTVAGNAKARKAAIEIAGRRGPPRGLDVEFDVALPLDGPVTVNRVRLVTETTDLAGSGSIGTRQALRLKGRTRLEEWLPYVSAPPGRGAIVVDDLVLEVAGDGRLLLTTSLGSRQLALEHARLDEVTVRSRIEGRLATGALAEMKVDLTLTAAVAERSNIRVEGLTLRERGTGRSDDYRLDAGVAGARVQVDDVAWEGVTVGLGGRLQDLLERRELTGLAGRMAFTRWKLGPVLWENGTADIALEHGTASLTNLVAALHGGRVTASGRLTPVEDRLAWAGEARAEGIVLTRQLGRPLSFLVPILRVGKEGSLGGRADVAISLSADDTTNEAILRTLRGQGSVRLRGIAVEDSILLPMLGLRLDTILRRTPYRFDDLSVNFAVGGGFVRPERFELEAKPFGITVRDVEIGLDGSIDALVIPSIFPALRVRGTLEDPKVRPAPLGRLLR